MPLLDLSDLRRLTMPELVDGARRYDIDNAGSLRKQDLIFEIARRSTATSARGDGVLETLPDGFGFLRSAEFNYQPGPDDIYVSPSQIRRFNLRTGDAIEGRVRAPKDGERYFALIKIETVNGQTPEVERDKILIDNLTPVHPTRRLVLEHSPEATGARIIDLVAPLAMGQRVAIWSPPRSGRSTLMQQLVAGIQANHPDVHVMVVLIDERPEEVSDTWASSSAEVLSSTFHEAPQRHTQVAEIALERARRLAEQGRDVVVVLDSLTRLFRAYQQTVPASGRTLRGVADPSAIHHVRKLFGSGRDVQEAGSITFVATLLTGTGEPADVVLADEIRPTTNAEIALDQDLADRGIFPAIAPAACLVRHVDRIGTGAEREQIALLRARLTGDPVADATMLLEHLQQHGANSSFLESLDGVALVAT